MKNLIFLSLIVVSLLSCNSKSNKTESTNSTETQTTETTTTVTDTTETTEPVAELYSCPMHPEVKGEKDSECPKCGMPLTEPVK